MSFRPFALALACALLAPGAHAADKILWQIPWKPGTTLTYATELLTDEQRGAQHSKQRATDTTQVRITQATLDGFVQAWTSKQAEIETLAGETRDAQLMRAFMQSAEGLVLEVELDKAGNYARVHNLDAVVPRMRAAFRPMLLAGVEDAMSKLPEKDRPAARDKALAQVDVVMERLLQPAVISALMTRTVQTYNAFVGLDVEPGMTYTLDTDLPNPIAEQPFPAKLSVTLTVSEDDADDLFVDYVQEIDAEKAMDALIATGEKMLGHALSEAERKAPIDLDVRDEGFFVVNRKTGVIEMFENTRTQVINGTRKVERNRMRQLDGDHEHTWKEEQTAAAEAASQES
jgi:hypothetical protein